MSKTNKMELQTIWTDSSFTKIKDYCVKVGIDPKTGWAILKYFKTKKQAENYINKQNE
tara:strand:+ start:5554 stop:5727 length:174 start_codon:yes stop_codon:yes gene_type:complete